MTALVDGVRRVSRAPALVAGVWVMTMVVSLPLTVALRGTIERQLGASLEASSVAAAANYDWMQEFSSQSDSASPSGFGSTFGPAVIGFAAVLDNLSSWLDRERWPVPVVGAAAVYVVLWIFLSGGVLDRFARDRATRAHGFFAACGVFFFRFLRLWLLAASVYALLFLFVYPLLFLDWYPAWTAEMTSERTVFAVRVSFYALFLALLAGWNLIVDYAKVRAVVEDRRSALGALVASAKFIGRNRGAVVRLYALNALLVGAVLAIYAMVAPGAGQTGPLMWAGFAISQAYVIARLWAKLLFWASETALFQSRLAHAGYVARPAPRWPDSPVVEAIQRS